MTLARVRRDAAACRNCPLWERATQTVFGEGDAHAALMLVGEQPGDEEDRGKRRIHQKPNASEIRACQPWLEAEIAAVQPELIVALGATAAQSMLGTRVRGAGRRPQPSFSPRSDSSASMRSSSSSSRLVS